MKMATLDHADAMQRGMMDIGQAARASGVSVKMIRHYEAIELLPKAARTFSNYRVYSPKDLHELRFIKRSRSLGFSAADIKELLGLWRNKTRSSAAVKQIAGRHADDLTRRIAELQAMASALKHLIHNCHGDDRPDCPVLDDLSEANEPKHHAAKVTEAARHPNGTRARS